MLEKVKNTPNLQGYAQQLEQYLTNALQPPVDQVKDKIYGLETFNQAQFAYNSFGINHTWGNQNMESELIIIDMKQEILMEMAKQT